MWRPWDYSPSEGDNDVQLVPETDMENWDQNCQNVDHVAETPMPQIVIPESSASEEASNTGPTNSSNSTSSHHRNYLNYLNTLAEQNFHAGMLI